MKSPPGKVLFAAVLCYVGAFIADYIDKIPPSLPTFTVMSCLGNTWSVWNYFSLVSLMIALGLTVAAFKLRD